MQAERLTPTRLFSDPPLSAYAPVDVEFAPDGTFLTYRQAADDDRERMDLWKVDLATAKHSLLVDARHLTGHASGRGELSVAERAERERRRQFSHGINHYAWHPDGQRLFLFIDGQALLVDVTDLKDQLSSKIHNVCPADARQNGFQLSPHGSYLSYVRDGDLYFTHIDTGSETRLTRDASPSLNNGLPDFLAAEEMHRFEGHWWSPDEQTLVFCKVDEAPVQISHRLEMDADGTRTVEQRYPYPGETNPRVGLWLANIVSGHSEQIWQDGEADAYLARVYLRDGEVIIQTQDRLQQHLRISSYHQQESSWKQIYQESSPTWINLTDDLRLLDEHRILLTTEQTGPRQALVLNADGSTTGLCGPTHINSIVAVAGDLVYALGWQDTPVENHLFAMSMSGLPCQRLTTTPGWHDIVIDKKSGRYLDRATSEDHPISLHVCDLTSQQAGFEIYTETFTKDHPYAPFMAHHAPSEFGEIAADDGQRLCYRLTPPARICGQHPVIVYVYGGPGPQKVRREWSPLTVQLFAQNGFAVLELDNRGTGNRGREFEAPIYGHLGCVEVTDQVAGLSALDGYAWADKSRIGVFGHSYGGYMALMCLAQANEHFAAGVAAAPVSDWQLYNSHYTERYMGLPGTNARGYEQANVLTHLHKINAPLLLMHGMADDNVLFTHSTQIMSKLQELGTPFELMTYPGAKHSMQERRVSIHRFTLILDFFARHLGHPISSSVTSQ